MRTTHSVHEIWLMDMVYILTKRIEKLAYRSVRAKESGEGRYTPSLEKSSIRLRLFEEPQNEESQ